MTSIQDYAENISQAIILRQPLPVMPELSIEEGYQLQKAVSKLINSESFPGLKAGVTSKEMQKLVGLSEPLIASIYERGKCESGSTITDTPKHELEFELGVIVDSEGVPYPSSMSFFAGPYFGHTAKLWEGFSVCLGGYI